MWDHPFMPIAFMVICIVFLGTMTSVITEWLKTRRKELDSRTSVDTHKMQAEIDRLSERVRVLERLATDSDTALADAFRKLA